MIILLIACHTQAEPILTPERPNTDIPALSPSQSTAQSTATKALNAQPSPSAIQIVQPTTTQAKRSTQTNEPPQPSEIIEPTYTRGPSPTIAPTNTNTPFPTISPNGLHLVYLVNSPGCFLELTLLDSHATSRSRYALPTKAYVDLWSAISPDGKRMAFYTGSAGIRKDGGYGLAEGPYDLALHMMDLSNGKTYTVTRLLSPDYPKNFERVGSILLKTDPSWTRFLENNADGLIGPVETIETHFVAGIRSFKWSPNSRHLAFAGQMDGDTSDVYVYDVQNNSIRRLTTGIEQIQWVGWSPDSKWVVHGATNELFAQGMTMSSYAVRVDGSKTIRGGCGGSWLDSDTCLTGDDANGPGGHNLRAINIETGETTVLWSDSFSSYAIDTQDKIVAIGVPDGYFDPSIKEGIYFLFPDGHKQYIIEGRWTYIYYDQSKNVFIAKHYLADSDPGISITTDGSVNIVPMMDGYVSPDGKWLITKTSGVDLYGENKFLVKHFALNGHVFWNEDSTGFYIDSGSILYYVTIPDAQLITVDMNISTSADVYNGFHYVKWLK